MDPMPSLTPAELEVLGYVSKHHPVSVRRVTEHFASTSAWARTTVLTLMERLREKGYLSRSKIDGVNHYSPTAPRAELLRGVVLRFVQRALGGSLSPFVAYLGTDAELSDAELAELKQVVQDLEARRQPRGTQDDQSR